MSSFTVHEVDSELDRRLTEEARRRNTSKNRLVKEILARALGLSAESKRPDDYQEFCGVWSAQEFAEFSSGQAENSTIDPEQWTP